MRRAIPCPTCATPIVALWQLFRHEPVCRWADDLRAREKAAREKSWLARKQLNRLQKKLEHQAKTINTGRGGISTARALRALATRVTQGVPVL